jgi:hypothetical protein
MAVERAVDVSMASQAGITPWLRRTCYSPCVYLEVGDCKPIANPRSPPSVPVPEITCILPEVPPRQKKNSQPAPAQRVAMKMGRRLHSV